MATTYIRFDVQDPVAEKSTWTHSVTLKKPDGAGGTAAITAAELASLKFWLRNATDPLLPVINSVNGLNVLNANHGTLHATNGRLTLTLHEADNPVVDQTKAKERHVGSIEAKYNGGTDVLRYEFFFTVESMVGV